MKQTHPNLFNSIYQIYYSELDYEKKVLFLIKLKDLLITGCEDGSILLTDPKTLEIVSTLKDHSGSITCLLTAEDEKYLYTGSADTTVKVWDVLNKKLLYTLRGHTK